MILQCACLALSLLPRLTPAETLGCTTLAIDGAASIDGAAFAVENTDCNNCDFRLNYIPPGRHEKGATRPLFMMPTSYPRWVGYGRGDIYHPKPGQSLSKPIASIPQVEQTFGYYESISPLMNDQGLGLGESSCSANLQNKPPESKEDRDAPTGLIDAMTMMQLALERCATARCAVDVLGDLGERYGYLPYGGEPTEQFVDGRLTWADSGEAYTIADATGEAWVLNMMGGVSGITKAVWAARRVPKGHLAVIANEFTLGELPEEQTDDFRFTKDIRRAAIAAGLWDGKGALDFSQVFAPDPTRYHLKGRQPIPMYSSLRRWRILSLAAPSVGLQVKFDQRQYPFSVKVEKPVSHRDVMAFMKDHYADTEFDMTQGILAGPYGTPLRVEGGPKPMGDVPRGISIFRTLYSTITQTGPGKSVLWYAPDTPATSVFVPLERHTSSVSHAYRAGHNRELDRSSIWWAFNFVSNWMQLNYRGMSTEDVLPRTAAWQDRIDREFEQHYRTSVQELNQWQLSLQEELLADWWKLGDFLIMKWNDMSHTGANTTEVQVGYPSWWAEMVGFSNDIHPVWVQPASRPGPSCPNVIEPTVSLPRTWSFSREEWLPAFHPIQLPSVPEVAQHLGQGLLLVSAGVVIGYMAGRHQVREEPEPKEYIRLA